MPRLPFFTFDFLWHVIYDAFGVWAVSCVSSRDCNKYTLTQLDIIFSEVSMARGGG